MLLAVLALHAGAFHWLASSLGERRIARSAEPVPLEVIMLNEVLEEPLPLQQPPPVTRPARSAKPSPQPKAQRCLRLRNAKPPGWETRRSRPHLGHGQLLFRMGQITAETPIRTEDAAQDAYL